MKYRFLFFLFFYQPVYMAIHAQNLVPNGSFENMDTYTPVITELNCLSYWRNYSGVLNPVLNTPDLCYASNPWSFPPTSIAPYDGDQYVAMNCGVFNPEYMQVRLTSPMVAGQMYCVSFYVSAYNQWNTYISPGACFSNTPLTINPTVNGLSSQVSSTVVADPALWQLFSDTYIASGGEEFMTIGGFENSGANFTYTYIDKVEVRPITPLLELGADRQLCNGETLLLDAGADGTAYLWSTGETTSSIVVTEPGVYTVEKFYGNCSFTDMVKVNDEGCEEPWTKPGATLYIPNTFTPNGDGVNDVFGAAGTYISQFTMSIFNRWGEEIFTAHDLGKTWNGMYNENPVPGGVYVYRFFYKPENGAAPVEKTGHVLLLR